MRVSIQRLNRFSKTVVVMFALIEPGPNLFAADADESQSRRSIPTRQLSEAASISVAGTGGVSTGSGFYITNGTNVFLVTAKHVLFPKGATNVFGRKAQVISYDRTFSSTGKVEVAVDLQKSMLDGDLRFHKSEDLCVVKIGTFTTAPEADSTTHRFARQASVTFRKMSKLGIVGAHLTNSVPFKDVMIGNDAFLFGYPSIFSFPDNPSVDLQKPLVRKGIIAGTNEGTKRIILDCPAYQGTSGGPVVQVIDTLVAHRYELIGVVVAFVPFKEDWANVQFGYTQSYLSNTGLSVAVPMDFVYELLY